MVKLPDVADTGSPEYRDFFAQYEKQWQRRGIYTAVLTVASSALGAYSIDHLNNVVGHIMFLSSLGGGIGYYLYTVKQVVGSKTIQLADMKIVGPMIFFGNAFGLIRRYDTADESATTDTPPTPLLPPAPEE